MDSDPDRAAALALRPQNVSGRVVATLFCSFFLVIGLIVLGAMVREMKRTVAAWRWPGVPCTIKSASVTHRTGEYQPSVSYRYSFGGRDYESDRFAFDPPSAQDYRAAHDAMRGYSRAKTATCYVDPQHPDQAVLRKSGLWIVLFTPLPLLAIAIGLFGVFTAWRGPPASMVSASQRPLSRVAKRNASVLLFLIFTVVGGLLFYEMEVRVILRVEAARNWKLTRCTVVSSAVQSHAGNGTHHGSQTTYSVDILYRYQIDHHHYLSSQYDFMGGSSSGLAAKQQIVQQYHPFMNTTCYVNPQDPEDAVLQPGYPSTLWFGVIPLLFLLVGVGGLVRLFRLRPWDTGVWFTPPREAV